METTTKKLSRNQKLAMKHRNNLLKSINDLENKICVEGFGTVLDWKESLGFSRYEEAKETI
jgi:hypothetical protein